MVKKKYYYIVYDNPRGEAINFPIAGTWLHPQVPILVKDEGQFTVDELLILKLKGLKFLRCQHGLITVY